MKLRYNLLKMIMPVVLLTTAVQLKAQQAFTIQGNLAKDQQGMVFLNFRGLDKKNVNDSAIVKDGVFVLKGTITDPSYTKLGFKVAQTGQEKAKRELREFFLEPGITTLKSTGGLTEALITGGKAQADYTIFMDLLKPGNTRRTQLDSLYRMYKAANNQEEMDKVLEEFKGIKSKSRQIQKDFVNTHPESFVAFSLWTLDLPSSPEAAIIEPEFNRFSTAIRNTATAKEVALKIAKDKKLSKGMMAPDFTLPDTLGKMVSLSSFRGKNVLLCFWQRNFYPFEAFSFAMTKVSRQLKSDDFAIVSIYYNPNNGKQDWKTLLKENGMNWTNLNDENGVLDSKALSAAAKAYMLDSTSFPRCILIGPDGKILDGHVNMATDPVAEIKTVLNK